MDLSTSSFRRIRQHAGAISRVRHVAFLAIALLTFFVLSALCAASHRSPRHAPLAGFANRGFVWYYQGFGVDYNIFRLNLFGVGKRILDADIIFYGSSKGLFGYRTDVLSAYVNRPEGGPPAKIFNASLAFGEGIAYFEEIVKSLDLHNKILVVDLSEKLADYFYTDMAKKALTEDQFSAYKTTLNLWLRYILDGTLDRALPSVTIKDGAWNVSPRLSVWYSRSWETGDDTGRSMRPLNPVVAGDYKPIFDPNGRVRKFLVDECRQRGIDVIFTTIPSGADPVWAQRIATELGLPYAAVDFSGLYTEDTVHLDPKSADIFSARLGEALAAPPISIGARLEQLHLHEVSE